MPTATENETKQRLLRTGEAFQVQFGPNSYYSRHDENRMYLHRREFASVMSASEAAGIAEEWGGEVVPAAIKSQRDGTIPFWVDEHGDGTFSERELSVAQPVRCRWDDIPQWFIKAMHVVAPHASEWGWDNLPGGEAEQCMMIFGRVAHGWVDHSGWSGEGEASHLVSEPYGINADGMKDLMNFVAAANLDVRIAGHSAHYPGATIRVEIFPK